MVVTHNMQQAARVSDFTAFLLSGTLVELSPTARTFHQALGSTYRGLYYGPIRLGERTWNVTSKSDLEPTQDYGFSAWEDSPSKPCISSMQSLLEADESLAERVVREEDAINQMQMEIDETVVRLLALHQLMAVDLRFVLAASRINADLERIGDQAVNIRRVGSAGSHGIRRSNPTSIFPA